MAEHINLDTNVPDSERVRSGCAGLDDVLLGGLPRGHFYLFEGDPGAGKTTLALQFLIEGVKSGERVLYVTLSESREDLLAVSRSHGFLTDGLEIFELLSNEEDLRPERQYTVFHPAEVELNDRMQTIVKEVERVKPDRLVIDALSELRMLARDPLKYRRQILSMKNYLTDKTSTVLLLDDRTTRENDLQLHSIVHGVISMEKISRDYGDSRRRLEITKLRGSRYRAGYHDYAIKTGGVVVFPRLVAAQYRGELKSSAVASGIPELDALVGGGLDRGTSTLLMGPAGCGKTTISMQWTTAAADRGENCAIFIFEEGMHTFISRAAGLGMDLESHVQSGRIRIEQVDPAEMSPGEFTQRVKVSVEQYHSKIVVIDSLNGYLQSMPGETYLASHLHELLAYLNNRGVLTIVILAQAGTIGSAMQTPVDVSYLADNILLLRYFETQGEVRQAISIIKKRSGSHERTIRELALGPDRVRVGKPLKEFHGVLTGIPTYLGSSKSVTENADGN
ncbi:MAG: AAA family ATPase [Acidobacteriota bacterium]|nr:AAA family ATPase [Acidobacteriota bacterium]